MHHFIYPKKSTWISSGSRKTDGKSFDETIEFSPSLYRYNIPESGGDPTDEGGDYGYQYDFNSFYNDANSSDGTILPSIEPSVFELKNPNQNIKGVVL